MSEEFRCWPPCDTLSNRKEVNRNVPQSPEKDGVSDERSPVDQRPDCRHRAGVQYPILRCGSTGQLPADWHLQHCYLLPRFRWERHEPLGYVLVFELQMRDQLGARWCVRLRQPGRCLLIAQPVHKSRFLASKGTGSYPG